MKPNLKIIPLCIGVFCLSIVAGVTIFAWIEPTDAPPNSNVAAPINVGDDAQTKTGALSVMGNVGIGTTVPSQKLDVAGSINVQERLCINGSCCNSWAECMALGYGGGPGEQPSATPFTQPITAPCTNDMGPKNLRVFVTSSAFTGSQVSNATQADNLCATVASAYALPGTYRALMYYADGVLRNPMSVLASDARYWNGSRASESDPICTWNLVADNPNDFLTSSGGNYLDNPIQYNEKALTTNFTVWTNFSATGLGNWEGLDGSNGNYGCTGVCNYISCGAYGCTRRGNSTAKDASWTNFATNTFGTCASCMLQSRAIYCVQQRAAKDDIAGPCSVTLPGNNKKIFVTSKVYTGYQVANVDLADAICQSHADNAKMTGTYKALMYYSDGITRNPYSVLAIGASFWNCGTDGDLVSGIYGWNPVASSPAEFFTADVSGNFLENPIKYDEMGKPTDSAVTVWTNFTATGSGNWSGLDGGGGTGGCTGVCNYISCGTYGCTRRGNSLSVDDSWSDYVSTSYGTCASCMKQSRAIYCVEQ